MDATAVAREKVEQTATRVGGITGRYKVPACNYLAYYEWERRQWYNVSEGIRGLMEAAQQDIDLLKDLWKTIDDCQTLDDKKKNENK